jgi:hypothetical protein
VLTEVRVVLPGAQALLGFQFAATLTDGFDRLPQAMKLIHFATPAAWHRLVERGELTERFHRFASWMVVSAMVPLALGLCGDLFVVTHKITGSSRVAALFASSLGALLAALWFGLGLVRRALSAARRAHPG